METIFTELIKVAGQLGIFAVASYWIQKSIDSRAAKRLEEFKSTLTLINAKDTTLHQKRFLIIEDLYGKFVDFDYSMRALTSPLKFVPAEENEDKLLEESNNAFQAFNMFFEKNKIYFLPNTCSVIENIREKFYSALSDYNQPRILNAMKIIDGGKIMREARLKALAAYGEVKDNFPVLRKDLETEFRPILNVI